MSLLPTYNPSPDQQPTSELSNDTSRSSCVPANFAAKTRKRNRAASDKNEEERKLTAWNFTTFEEHLQELSKYFDRHGHLRVREEEHKHLYRFLQQNRRDYQKLMNGEVTQMCAERLVALEAIGIEWNTTNNGATSTECEDDEKFDTFSWIHDRKIELEEKYIPDDLWEQRIKELTIHYAEMTRIGSVENYENRRKSELQEFIHHVQEDHAHLCVGLPSNLAEFSVRRQQLKATGFFSSTDGGNIRSYDDQWEFFTRQLYDIKLKRGNCVVSLRHKNRELRDFVMKQRRDYQLLKEHRLSALTQERVDQLNAMGFDWKEGQNHLLTVRKEDSWKVLIGEARSLKGKRDLPMKSKLRELRNNCRRVMEGSYIAWLPPERIAELMSHDFNFEWSKPPEKHFIPMWRLSEFYKKVGHCNVPVPDSQLVNFKRRRRNEYTTILKSEYVKCRRENTNDLVDGVPSVIVDLYSMGFDWGDENKLVWDRRIEELRKYKNCEVPCEENPILFDFVKLHATIYKLVMKKRGSDTNSRSFMHKRLVQLKELGIEKK